MGLPDLIVVHVGRGLEITLDTTQKMSPMIDGIAWTHGCSVGRGVMTTLDTAR